jgi:hypothetical protein
MNAATRVPPKRRKYTPPKLVRYGDVRALTQSGSRPMVEVAGMLMQMPSERRVKERILRVGTHPLGIGLYLFEYRAAYRDAFGHGRRLGVMADEVEALMPEAVFLGADGFKRVDYAMLGMHLPADGNDALCAIHGVRS